MPFVVQATHLGSCITQPERWSPGWTRPSHWVFDEARPSPKYMVVSPKLQQAAAAVV